MKTKLRKKNSTITVPKILKRHLLAHTPTPAEKVLYQIANNFTNSVAVIDRGVFSKLTIERWEKLKSLLNPLLERYNSGKFKVEIFQNNTNVDILVLEECVIRLFSEFKEFPLNHRKVLEIRNDSKHLEHFLTHSTSEDFVSYIVSEKLISLDKKFGGAAALKERSSDEISIDVLCAEVFEALTYLHKNGIQHSDAKIENIGIRPTDGSFVFFDLECVLVPGVAEREKTVETDFKDFIISLKGHFKNHERLHLYSDFPNIFKVDK